MTLFLLKLFLVPTFLALISFAGRRWGPGIAGWLAGFPLSTGPALIFLALERGAVFTAQAAVLSVASVFSAIVFTIAYGWACTRMRWPGAFLCAYAAWFATLPLLQSLPPTLWLLFALSALTLVVGPRLFPAPQGELRSGPLPMHELLLRMVAGAAMILTVTGVAEAIGPAWTGYFSGMPVMTSLLTLFSHRTNGPAFTIVLLRSMVGGFCALLAYCTCVALLLESWGFAATILTAIAAAVAVQGATRVLMTRRAAREAG